MKLVLTHTDLEAMPAGLRQQVFPYAGADRGPYSLDQATSTIVLREHEIILRFDARSSADESHTVIDFGRQR